MKPGYKTTEFWLALAAVMIGGVTASGAVHTGPVAQGAGLLAMALGAMGYSASRAWAKVGEVGKAGWKTTEFWLTLLAVVAGGLISSGALPATGLAAQILGIVSSALAAMGYGVSRGIGKTP